MQKAIKYSKFVAWIGIILIIILLTIIFVLYNDYLDASWAGTLLNILRPIAIIAGIMMYGGIIVKAILEYKSGSRPIRATTRDLIIISLAIVIAVVYYVAKLFFFR